MGQRDQFVFARLDVDLAREIGSSGWIGGGEQASGPV